MTLMSKDDSKVISEMIAIARDNGLEIDPSSIKLNETGMDFIVGMAKDEKGIDWILRKPRRKDVLERANEEYKVLQFVQSYLPVTVPEWKIFTPELIAYHLLEGEPAANIDLDIKNYVWNINQKRPSDTFIESIARALVALHGIESDAAKKAGLRVKTVSESRRSFVENMNKVKDTLGVSKELLERWQSWLDDDSYWPEHTALVHGDFQPAHWIVNQNEKVIGLLDWTEAEVDDPAIDFVIYYGVFGDEGLDRLLDQYAKAGGKVWPRMKDHIMERAAAYPVAIGLFALTTGEDEHLEMARGALGVTEIDSLDEQ